MLIGSDGGLVSVVVDNVDVMVSLGVISGGQTIDMYVLLPRPVDALGILFLLLRSSQLIAWILLLLGSMFLRSFQVFG